MSAQSNLSEKLHNAWGDTPDAWLVALAGAVDTRGVKAVADTVGCSSSMVSAVINKSYNGTFVHIEKKVRDALMRGTVHCPVAEEITGERCAAIQRRKKTSTNPLAIRLYQACRSGCPNSSLKDAS